MLEPKVGVYSTYKVTPNIVKLSEQKARNSRGIKTILQVVGFYMLLPSYLSDLPTQHPF